MREEHLQHLACPECEGDLVLNDASTDGELIRAGTLACVQCTETYPIVDYIPRFVPRENYASGFGLEWTIHWRTQHDAYTGLPLSKRRFFEETRWPLRLEGEIVLEVGSGSGRFTTHAASTGATVISVDYSYAVEANYRWNGGRRNVIIAQGDVFRLPVRSNYVDKIFCLGVLQHTPDPRRALLALPRHLKPGGNLVVDIYRASTVRCLLEPKYWIRPLTRRISPETLYRVVRRYVDLMWPLASLIRRIPRIGPSLNWRLLVADYSRDGLTGDVLKEWAYLDTFDMLAPRYDQPADRATLTRWFSEAGLVDVEVTYGYNGIEGRGSRPGAI